MPERSRGLFEIPALGLHERNEFASDERRCDEHRGQDDAGDGEKDLDAVGVERRAEYALQPVDEEVGDTRNDRRDRERDFDDDQQEGFAAEVEFGDGPSRGDTEGGIDRNGNERSEHCQHDRVPGVGMKDRVAINLPPLGKGFDANDQEGCEDEEGTDDKDDADQHATEEGSVADAGRSAAGSFSHGQVLSV